MSSAQAPVSVNMTKQAQPEIAESALAQSGSSKSNYKGFVAGVFSGIAKLSGEFSLRVAFCFYFCS
jgi:solute carrier family 25 carnitine/acylcarnitine transporter 20/29